MGRYTLYCDGLNTMYTKIRQTVVSVVMAVAITVRQYYLGKPGKASLDGVYLNPMPDPKTMDFQDLLITSRLGMVDVTTKYKQRLGFQDPATYIDGVQYNEVWRNLCRGVEGMDPKEHGRIEVDFRDHNGNRRSVVITPEDEDVILPLYRKKQSKLSIGVFKAELTVRRIDVDENGDEISFCIDPGEDSDEEKVKLWIDDELKKWMPNKNVVEADDDTLFRLALRDSIFKYRELYDIFNPPTDREKFKYVAEVRILYTNLDDTHRSLTFDWETYPKDCVVGKSN